MKTAYKMWCRTYQGVMKIACYLLPWRKPKLLSFDDGVSGLPKYIKDLGYERVLLVASNSVLNKSGLLNGFLQEIENNKMSVKIFDKVTPNPTIQNVEDALTLYRDGNCQVIVTVGGGSPMDCAKAVAGRVARPKKSVEKMKGLLKIMKKTPPLFAVPTTSGSGSETTLAAVISNPATNEKYAINDVSLIPSYAILDPKMTVGLSPEFTATTGIDALTHAVEAYIGNSNTKETREMALKATQLIFKSLFDAYTDGTNIEARRDMQLASYYAGIAFTRAYVGYVHAIAHTLGGFYHTAHGLANAVILPYVLEAYGESAYKPLAELADAVNITAPGDDEGTKANKFIQAIRKMREDMNIPDKFDFINKNDIPKMAERAAKEGNPLYPVPKLIDKDELAELYNRISI